jgi:S1-C subfamily serine protease
MFAAGCRSTVEKQGEAPPPAPVVQQPPPTPAAPSAPAPVQTGQGYDVLKITAELSAGMLESANRQGCPSSALSALFGVQFSQMHGCVIGSITAGGLAEKVGLKPGDSIVGCNGGEATCPRTLVPLLSASKEPGKIELIVHRPKAG